MTAIVSRERAKPTCLIAAAGLLMLAAAVAMMFAAAPALARPQAAGPQMTSARLTAALSHQVVVRACAQVYTLSMVGDR